MRFLCHEQGSSKPTVDSGSLSTASLISTLRRRETRMNQKGAVVVSTVRGWRRLRALDSLRT